MVSQAAYIKRITAEVNLLLTTTIALYPSLPKENLPPLFEFYSNCREFSTFIEGENFSSEYETSVDLSKIWLNFLMQEATKNNFLECIPVVRKIDSLLQSLPRNPMPSPSKTPSKDEFLHSLERKIRALEVEYQLLHRQFQILEKERNRFKSSIPYPTPIAVIQSLVDENRAIVKVEKEESSFIAQIPPDIPRDLLAPGIMVKIHPTYHVEAILS
ncbi:MAG: hypothetical protein EAX86_09555 [Candidatus Heimdallarchaeota archaeon]|nr:hypothetical protein [Candidatus Heimdallarchaeota archaeon]